MKSEEKERDGLNKYKRERERGAWEEDDRCFAFNYLRGKPAKFRFIFGVHDPLLLEFYL